MAPLSLVPPVLPDLFTQRFGHVPTHVASAPGRVNLIGEHTDYNGGFVFPAAIDLRLTVLARVTDGPSQIASLDYDGVTEFTTDLLLPGSVTGWARYAAGVAWAIGRLDFPRLPNVQALVMSDIPIGSGVSSSAALEMAFATLWNELGGLGLTHPEMAAISREAENHYAGVTCGIMDQMASAMGRADHAFFLDTHTLELQYAPVPHDLRIVLCDTTASRALAASAYNERVQECAAACQATGVDSLRNATLADLDRAGAQLSPTVYQRARHVLTENDRCRAFASALQAGRLDEVGDLMRASHASLRVDYEVTSDALDAMADAANAAPGVIGARMTGAGFGGACVALVQADRIEEFIAATQPRYQTVTGLQGRFTVCRAAPGAIAGPL